MFHFGGVGGEFKFLVSLELAHAIKEFVPDLNEFEIYHIRIRVRKNGHHIGNHFKLVERETKLYNLSIEKLDEALLFLLFKTLAPQNHFKYSLHMHMLLKVLLIPKS